MKIEHIAYQVADPPAVAAWYVEHLGLTVARKLDGPPYTHFLADDGRAVMIEFYHNPLAPIPDYAAQHSLVLHLALTADDVAAERDRLVAAGASVETDVAALPNGDTICMLRDPWGFAVQLVKRAVPMT